MYSNLLEIATIRSESFGKPAMVSVSLSRVFRVYRARYRAPRISFRQRKITTEDHRSLSPKSLLALHCVKFQSTLQPHLSTAVSAPCCSLKCNPANTCKSPAFPPSPGRTRFGSSQPHTRCKIGRARRRGLRAGLPGSTARSRFRNRGDHPPARG
jgi:hypothetical protein